MGIAQRVLTADPNATFQGCHLPVLFDIRTPTQSVRVASDISGNQLANGILGPPKLLRQPPTTAPNHTVLSAVLLSN
eukprot:scaffold818_cov124-Skeletonema_marinoi.AAC.5